MFEAVGTGSFSIAAVVCFIALDGWLFKLGGGRHLFFAGVLDKLYRGLFKRGYLSGMLRTYQLYNIGRTYRIDEKIAC